MPCMCGDTACWSCGPAQGSPSCEYSRYKCGDETCPCALDPKFLTYFEEDGLAEQLAEEALLAAEEKKRCSRS